MNRLLGFVAVVGLCLSLRAHASDHGVCDVALSSNAINKTDFEQTSRITYQKKEDLCRREYNSVQEFREEASASGFNLGYKGLELGHSGGRKTGSGRLSFSEETFCQANQVDLSSEYQSKLSTSVADIALRAWQACIETTEKDALYIEYETAAGNSGVKGFINRRVVNGSTEFVITEMMVQPAKLANKVKCQVGHATVSLGKLNIKLTNTREGFACDKPPGADVGVSFGTNIGDLDWIRMPSEAAVEQKEIGVVSTKVQQLEQELLKVSENLSTVSDTLKRRAQIYSAPFEITPASCDKNAFGGGGNKQAICRIPVEVPGEVLGGWVQVYGGSGHTFTNVHVSRIDKTSASVIVHKYVGDLDKAWRITGEVKVAYRED